MTSLENQLENRHAIFFWSAKPHSKVGWSITEKWPTSLIVYFPSFRHHVLPPETALKSHQEIVLLFWRYPRRIRIAFLITVQGPFFCHFKNLWFISYSLSIGALSGCRQGYASNTVPLPNTLFLQPLNPRRGPVSRQRWKQRKPTNTLHSRRHLGLRSTNHR